MIVVGWTPQDPYPFDFAQGRMTAGTCNGKDKSEMRGSLHFATHDETVSRFGRDDALAGRILRDRSKSRSPIRLRSGQALPDDTRKAKTTATANAQMRM
jgi:hypothetical protein